MAQLLWEVSAVPQVVKQLPREVNIFPHKTCTSVLITASLLITKWRKEPKCPQMDEWVGTKWDADSLQSTWQ